MLLRDEMGEIIPLGRTIRVLDEVFIPGTALPSWLVCDLGTASFGSGVSGTTNPGQVTIATAAANNAFARLKTSFTMAAPQYKEIIWTIGGLIADTDGQINYWFSISADGNAGGVDLYHDPSTDTALLRTTLNGSGVNGTYATNYRLIDGAPAMGMARHYRNLTMRLRPGTATTPAEVIILEDDHDMITCDISSTFQNVTNLRAAITIQTRDGTAHNFKISRATLTLIH